MARLYEFKEEEEKSCRKKFYAKNNSTRKTKVKRARAHTEYLMWHATIWQSGCFAVVCLRFSCAISRDFKQQTTNERMQLVYVRAPAWRVICARRLRDHDIEFVDGVGGMHVANIYMRLSVCVVHWPCWIVKCSDDVAAIIICAVVQTAVRQFCPTISSFVCFLPSAKFPINIWIIVVEENLAVMRFPLLRSHTDWQHNWHFCAINCKYVRANFLPASLSGSVALRLARCRGAAIQNYRCWWIFFSFMVIACTQFGNKLLLNFICWTGARWAAVGVTQLVRMRFCDTTFIDGYIAECSHTAWL